MMNELKTVLWVNQGGLVTVIQEDGVDLNLVCTLFFLRVFRLVTVKTSLLMQICIALFDPASVLEIYFFQLSHNGNSLCTPMIFSVPISYKTKKN
jgi:hypothetical protein